MTVDISSDWVRHYGTNLFSYSFQTYVHETGHALGLGHQGPYNGSATYGVDNTFANDTWQYSVMSYFSQNNYGGSTDWVMTPQVADVVAVTGLYGAATSTRTDNTIYGFHSNAGGVFNFANYYAAPSVTIVDSDGIDTLDLSGYGFTQLLDLRAGHFSSAGGMRNNIGISTTTVLENAVGGTANDVF
jgi:serralysin